MKLKLKKEELTTLSDDTAVISDELTPQVGGADHSCHCQTEGCQFTDNCRRTLMPGETCGVYTCPPIL